MKIYTVITLVSAILVMFLALFSVGYQTAGFHYRPIIEDQADTITDLRDSIDVLTWYYDTNQVICAIMADELEAWRDHGNRFRLILDIPDTIPMSYSVKCAYSVSTRRLVGKNAIYLKPND